MQSVAELDLMHLPLEDPEFGKNPYPYFTAAREKHPWLAKSNYGYIVHDYKAIKGLYALDKKMHCSFESYLDFLGARDTPWGRFTQEQIMSMPVEPHRVLRDAVADKFKPKFVNELRPMMRENITRLLDEWAPKGAFNFEEFVSKYPISNMFNLIGAPPEELENIRLSLEMLGVGLALGPSRLPEIQAAYLQLENLVLKLIADRRADPGSGERDDLLNLVIALGDSDAVSERQLVDMLIFFFVAGYDTSKNVMTFIMYILLEHPDLYQRCAEDLEYCQRVVEEGLRYFNPAISPRIATEDLEFRDVLLPKDTTLLFALSISGRDPKTFSDPDVFNPDRPIENDKRHLAFGLGRHMCLGLFVARAQMQEGLHLISQRLRNPRLAGEVGWRPFASTWGLHGLPITFTPA